MWMEPEQKARYSDDEESILKAIATSLSYMKSQPRKYSSHKRGKKGICQGRK